MAAERKSDQKLLVMTQVQLQDFEAKCLDHLPYKEAKRIVTYLSRYVVSESELVPQEK